MNMTNSQESQPTVSIIVPVYNAQENIAQLIESLLNQTYPKNLLEIIIVDNNSTDQTKDIVCQFPITLLERNDVQSSYAARNQGIQKATGEYLALIDSDCIATYSWVAEGIKALLLEPADLAAGKVEFYFTEQKSAAEMYDSITHLQGKQYVTEKQAAETANLFVKASLFKDVGLFPEVASGADVIWTKQTTDRGFKLIYAPEAVVRHPARTLKQLLKKRYRTGTGTIAFWKSANAPIWWMFAQILRRFLPRRPSMIKKAIQRKGTPDMNQNFFSIWLVSYLCGLFTVLGILISALPFTKRNK